jgi:hypothetical protein
VQFRFDVNPGRAVAESDYANNIIQRSFCWERHDGRFVSLRLGRNYTTTCQDCAVVIRPADVTDMEQGQLRILNRTVTLLRYLSSTLNVYFGSGESGALEENNEFGFHPNFVGF